MSTGAAPKAERLAELAHAIDSRPAPRPPRYSIAEAYHLRDLLASANAAGATRGTH